MKKNEFKLITALKELLKIKMDKKWKQFSVFIFYFYVH